MEKILWNCYEKFTCLAQNCPDSCCQGWEVDVDRRAAEQYLAMEGPLGDRLRQVLIPGPDGATMRLEQGRCPMWQPDGLCRLQKELGHDALCQVCREYPRLYMDFGDFAQWGLELSCPEAARLILADMGAVTVPYDGGQPEYDTQAMKILRLSQDAVLGFLQHTGLDVPQSLAVLLIYAHQVQSALDGGSLAPLQPEACLQTAQGCKSAGRLQSLLDFYAQLEILTDQWRARLKDPREGKWDGCLRNMAVYLVRRYWLQAVWDYDLVCRAKFLVAACILVNALGGDPVSTAQLFSKEIENDPDNREAILDAAYTHPALTDRNLFGLLL